MKVAGGPKSHLSQLDALRGAAALAVFFFHGFTVFVGIGALPWNGPWRDWGLLADRGGAAGFLFYPLLFGHLGVPLFFVLSGYCVHKAFLDDRARLEPAPGPGPERRLDWRRFLPDFAVRRFMRIYPAYGAALFLCAFLLPALLHSAKVPDGTDLPRHLLLVHNLSIRTAETIDPPAWSIGTEMQLYLLYPLFMLMRSRWGSSRALAASLAATAAAHVAALLHPDSYLLRAEPLYFWFSWTLGAWLVERHAEGRPVFRRRGLWLAGLAAVYIAGEHVKPLFPYVDFYGAEGLCQPVPVLFFGCLIEVYVHRERLNPFERGLAAAGLVSYSVYLLHSPFLRIGRHLFAAWPPLLGMTAGLLLILVPLLLASALFYRAIEKPFHLLGKRLARSF